MRQGCSTSLAHSTELAPEGVARDRERELVPDPLGQIGKPPAHYTVRGENWPGLDNRRKPGALLAVQVRATPRRLARRQTAWKCRRRSDCVCLRRRTPSSSGCWRIRCWTMPR